MNITPNFSYGAFGEGGERSAIGFAGRWDGYTDENVGTLSWNRWYLGEQARWGSRDPFGIADNPNPYLYVANQPTLFGDPFGLAKCECNYSIRSGVLSCTNGKNTKKWAFYSGKKNLRYNPANVDKEDGPIPTGEWQMTKPQHYLSMWDPETKKMTAYSNYHEQKRIFLLPYDDTRTYGRDAYSFQIHRAGGEQNNSSTGCLVPEDNDFFDAMKKHCPDGGKLTVEK